jgi:zinc transporter
MNNKTGLINCRLLDGNGGGRELSRAELDQWDPESGVLWIHWDLNSQDAFDWLEQSSELPEIVREALTAQDTRPRAVQVENGLLIALRGVNLNPGADPKDMVSIRIWLSSERIISTRHRVLLSVRDIVGTLDAGTGPSSPSSFLVTLCDRIVERMSDTVDNFEEQVAQLEVDLLENESSQIRSSLASIRRQIISIRRYLAPQREAINTLVNDRSGLIDDEDKFRLREVNDRLTRYIEDLDAVRERAAVVQEELLSRLSEALNGRMYVLSIVAAVFLPLGFLTGLLGINVGGIPGAENHYAFLIFLAILVAILLVQLIYFKRNRWF